MELLVQALASLSFSFFLLEFVHIVVFGATTHGYVDIFSCNTRFFVELHILYLLVSEHDLLLQMEMDQYNKFIIGTRLEEAMFHIGEADIYFVAFMSGETNTISMNFQLTN